MNRTKSPSSGDMPQRSVSRSESSVPHLVSNHNQSDLSSREAEKAKPIKILRQLELELEDIHQDSNYRVWMASLTDHLRVLLPPDSTLLSLVKERLVSIENRSISLQESEKKVLREVIHKVIDYIECHGIYLKPKDHVTSQEIGRLQESRNRAFTAIMKILSLIAAIFGTPITGRAPKPKIDQYTRTTIHREDSPRNIKKLNYPPDNTTIRNNNTTKDRK